MSQLSSTSSTPSIGQRPQPVETPCPLTGTTECTFRLSLHWVHPPTSSPIYLAVRSSSTSTSTKADVAAWLPSIPLSCPHLQMIVTRSNTVMAPMLAVTCAQNLMLWRRTSTPSEVPHILVIITQAISQTATAMDSVTPMCFLTDPLASLPQDPPRASTPT